ncbi:MAG TPA: hypothetical protein VJU59_27245 [Paraburkholderia sp.]|uniref:hypothetical protein n=1 Tax=Paraburkholderia sp. TaxID=1926495 RepID=UPI002B4A2170|nr:hypothetical protein [Paraburkholderia sp.]HKR43336.1 hypothetical protein [Paraburkholderia sp.]
MKRLQTDRYSVLAPRLRVAYAASSSFLLAPETAMTDIPRFFTTSLFVDDSLPELAIVTIPGAEHPQGPRDDPLLADAAAAKRALHLLGEWTVRSEGIDAVSEQEVNSRVRGILANDMFYIGYGAGTFIDAPDDWLAEIPFAVMNSPIAGSTLAQLFAVTGSGAAFLAYFPHPGWPEITTYFLVVGGTKIVFGAADGIGYALKHGLAHVLLKWMGAPTNIIQAEEDRTRAREAKTFNELQAKLLRPDRKPSAPRAARRPRSSRE